MQAILNDRYGPVDALRLRDIEPPTIGAAEVLVRVHASALHIGDVFAIRGRPLPMRLMTGLMRPTYGVPGFDLAGTVEAVGANVTRFKPGDDVFGTGHGTTAELARADETTLAPKPPSLTFEEAAAIPTSALLPFMASARPAGPAPGSAC
jgi:NADPH:quinone reductase-like Zn-dependent oxidoreductase